MLFGRKKQVKAEQSTPVGDVALQALLTATLRAVSVNRNSDFNANDGTAKAMQNYLDRNADETASDQARELFHFAHNGKQIYPLFTSAQQLDEWLAKNPFAGQGFTALTVLSFQGASLFRRFLGVPATVIVVLDPMSSSQRILSNQELQALAQS